MITGFGEDELYQALEKGPDPGMFTNRREQAVGH